MGENNNKTANSKHRLKDKAMSAGFGLDRKAAYLTLIKAFMRSHSQGKDSSRKQDKYE